jgi:GH25 family lysozyme M1 (1,4-beta-N-acetylmuramidase)
MIAPASATTTVAGHAIADAPMAKTSAPKPVQEKKVIATKAPGIDVSRWQGPIDWQRVAKSASFAYVKATEGTGYVSRTFDSQYSGAKAAGLYVGAYAFGRPDAPALAQADYFVDHARWSPDGKTLPPMLDMEWPYDLGNGVVAPYPCYGISARAMVAWIKTFVDEVKRRTGSVTTIYTAAGWWNNCTGGSAAFASEPLFVASYVHDQPKLPVGWTRWTIWQHSASGSLPGDQNFFNGSADAIAALAAAP